MSLRSAFILSGIVHVCVFAPLYNQNLLRHGAEKRSAVVVNYIILKEMMNVTPAHGFAVRRAADGPARLQEKAMQAGGEVVLKEPAAPKVDVKKGPDKASYKKRFEARKLKEAAAAKKEAGLKQSKDYISYYGFIKDRIRARLKENYRYYNYEGEVYLSFAIAQNGALLTYNIDRARSAANEVLLHITIASLKAITPFPPFPKTLPGPKTSFSIVISFKK